MQLALDLAHRGQGFVEPNPMVGCVIVKGGRIIGRGLHRKFGGPHAEVNALRGAGRQARGAMAFVTLEPCCHTGKTPPCCDALIRAKIKRVVVAMKDPNPCVAGRGLARLRRAGIRVELGLLRAEAMALNAPFITVHTLGRPYVILKWAQSIDGKIATRTGDSKWISGRESRAAGHAIRARVDAVIVGVNTVIADDPDLTARMAKPRRIAARIVLDPDLRTPLGAGLVRTAGRTPTIIVAGSESKRVRKGRGASSVGKEKALRLRRAGCEVVQLPSEHGRHGRGTRGGRSGIELSALLRELGAREMTNVLVEGGGRVLGSFLAEGLADEAQVFVAPRLIGGESAPGPLGNIGPACMADLPRVTLRGVTRSGDDLWYNLKIG